MQNSPFPPAAAAQRAVTLTVFGWRWPDPAINAAALKELKLTALARLWGQGRRVPLATADYAGWIAQRAPAGELPEAALLLAASGTAPEPGCWLRMDAVNLDLHNDQLVLQPLRSKEVRSDEREQLFAALQQHFAREGWILADDAAGRWYLRLPQRPSVSFVPLQQVAGRSINQAMPQGADALFWHGLINEIQMLFYTHPVNDARSAAGEPLISGVWFSGLGEWPLPAPLPALAPMLHADDPLLAAIQHAAGQSAAALPASFASSVRHAVLDQALPVLQGNDPVGWFACWQALELNWFAPLLAAWQGRELEFIRIEFPELGMARELTPASRWQFWKRAGLPK
ncbi:hypothetical protein [Chitinilyticum piscinae]|uniref:Cofactor-independent phosphoglycerate mutase n=1 Tax=Chitinilyticum piscinae TaxID=2866724 RepID=A0A8J7FP54_9NEIS|nr:hypothetical protein [Chitinilyticum piscinae]MBE9609659.1 hypothetical protein [Chitinilyticum piscinae]